MSADRSTADNLLARVVHAAWRDGMLAQGREVAPNRMKWETLSEEDQALDICIAENVALALATEDLPFLPVSITTSPTGWTRDQLALFAKIAQGRGQSLWRADQKSGQIMLILGYGVAQLLAETEGPA